jgi:putative membrane protein
MPEPSPREREVETLRVHLANERTMLAWIRSGISLMAFGFAIARFGIFLRHTAAQSSVAAAVPPVGSTWVGAVLVGVGMLVNLIATFRYGQIRAAIERGEVGAPHGAVVYVFGGLATLIGLLMGILLWRALGS